MPVIHGTDEPIFVTVEVDALTISKAPLQEIHGDDGKFMGLAQSRNSLVRFHRIISCSARIPGTTDTVVLLEAKENEGFEAEFRYMQVNVDPVPVAWWRRVMMAVSGWFTWGSSPDGN